MRHTDEVVLELALQQAGAFGRWQLLPRGVEQHSIRARLRSGTWIVRGPGVYALPGVRPTYVQRLWVAWLGVGPAAVVSHESAAELHAIPNVQRGRLTLSAPHGTHHRIVGAFVHQVDDIAPEHRTGIDGLPVTTPVRTIVDLAAVVHPARLERLVEDSVHARIVTYEGVGECLVSVARRGKPGVRPLARVLSRLTETKAKAQSVLESAAVDLLRAGGVRGWELQLQHPGRSFTTGCVDVGFRAERLVYEVDGRAWHTRIQQIRRDHERDAEAARAGWLTLRRLYEHVVGDPEGELALVRDVLADRRRLLLPA